jgi:transporter family-2 protein
MSLWVILPFVLGTVAVFQAAFNRRIAAAWGLAPAALLNTAVLLVVGLTFLWWSSAQRNARPHFFQPGGDLGQFRLWWLLPGLFGFSLLTGLPYALAKLGALRVFVALVASQVLTSLIWDATVEKIDLTWPRLLGAGLALGSVVLNSWK